MKAGTNENEIHVEWHAKIVHEERSATVLNKAGFTLHTIQGSYETNRAYTCIQYRPTAGSLIARDLIKYCHAVCIIMLLSLHVHVRISSYNNVVLFLQEWTCRVIHCIYSLNSSNYCRNKLVHHSDYSFITEQIFLHKFGPISALTYFF